jgi:putative addiction module CopG family antidote
MQTEFMNVSLPAPLEEFIQRKVADGQFRTADEVVCEAIRLLQDHETWKVNSSEAIETGWEQAKTGQLRTPEEAHDRLAVRKEAWRAQRG